MEIVKSTVYTSMQHTNDLGCSLALIVKEVEKKQKAVLIVWKDLEVAIFDYFDLKRQYLLLKHYFELEYAKKDFFKLIGKMCKKPINEPDKYFLMHKEEDNRIVFIDFLKEIDILQHSFDLEVLDKRKEQFLDFINKNIQNFTSILR